MPRKAGLIKTYGRHKFRTVKTASWASPDDVFRSPVSKKEKSFETPTTIRKTALKLTTNLPRSYWNVPKHETHLNNDKENVPVNEQNKDWKKNSNISTKNTYSTPTCPEQEHSSKWFSSSSLSSPNLSTNDESFVILRHKWKQSSNKITSVIPETPEFTTFNQENRQNISDKTSSYNFQDPSFSSTISPNSSVKSKSSFSKNENEWISPLCQSFGSDISSAEQPLRASQVRSTRFGNDPSCSTSTPIIRANSRNSQLVTLRGRDKQRYPINSSSTSLPDCQVFVQPMKLTPEQYQAARSSLGEGNTSGSSSLTFYLAKESSESDLSKVIDASNLESQIQETRKNSRISSSIGSTDGFVRDCVVSLEKLKLSPLIGQEGRKRSSSFSVSGNSSCVSGSSDDLSMPSTPPRKQASHMSFVEALTPMKISPSTRELTAYQKLLLECEQDAPMKFNEYLSPSSMKKCIKIGEGVYGEVFKAVNKYKQAVALKIIPINGDFEVNGEPQKSSEEILPEIIISKELSALKYSEEIQENSTPNFIDVNRVSLVQDKYPAHLIREWIKWDKTNQSENDKPDIFPSDQCFLVFEFANGGQDLEHFEFNSNTEAMSVLQQITLSLAVAESSLEFEHRDLHWGNVLIIRNNQQEINYHLNGQAIQINSHGVHVSIIDFTLSRLRKDGVTVFCNLSEDESLFTGKGDYQFEIYRQMRKSNEDDWEKFTPTTNVQWIHYLTDKIRNKKYPSSDRKTKTWLRSFFNQVQECQSAQEVIYSDFFGEM